ncbi:MAG TPA: arginine--tRNA ligase, partial [Bacteroidia bacterium]
MEDYIKQGIADALLELYGHKTEPGLIKLENTNQDFKGDYTFVCFPFLRLSGKGPEQTATEIGEFLKKTIIQISGFNVVKGFLNLEITDIYWIEKFAFHNLEIMNLHADKVMVEYSSPNTNKPLHLGHVRNNLLGYSVSKILEAAGNKVVKSNLINDRGIHICKSMIAWEKFGNGETPESSGMKGD